VAVNFKSSWLHNSWRGSTATPACANYWSGDTSTAQKCVHEENQLSWIQISFLALIVIYPTQSEPYACLLQRRRVIELSSRPYKGNNRCWQAATRAPTCCDAGGGAFAGCSRQLVSPCNSNTVASPLCHAHDSLMRLSAHRSLAIHHPPLLSRPHQAAPACPISVRVGEHWAILSATSPSLSIRSRRLLLSTMSCDDVTPTISIPI
jgi:hypothetical protein